MENEKFKAWRNRNPLRAWRRKSGFFQSMVAASVGATAQTVRDWESGSSMPSPNNMVNLAHIMGIDVQTLADSWSSWVDQARVNK